MDSPISYAYGLVTFFNGKPTSCYKTVGINVAFRGCTLSIIRCTSAAFLALGVCSTLLPHLMGTHAFLLLPSAAGKITTLAFSILLGSSLVIEKIRKNEFYFLRNGISNGNALQTTKNEPQKYLDLLYELAEQGDYKVSLQRAQEIVQILKDANKLYLLNAKFPYQSAYRNVTSDHYLTPLHYWAGVGNLDIVKLLVSNGAYDHFTSCGFRVEEGRGTSLRFMKSAIFFAASNKHDEVVRFLIECGFSCDKAFNEGDYFFSLIPLLVHCDHSCYEREMTSSSVMRLILNDLHKKNPNNLQFQFRIPITNKINSLKWLKLRLKELKNDNQEKKQYDIENIKKLIKLFKEFGAKEEDVFSLEQFLDFKNGREPLDHIPFYK